MSYEKKLPSILTLILSYFAPSFILRNLYIIIGLSRCVATGGGLRGRTDGRARQAQAASGKWFLIF